MKALLFIAVLLLLAALWFGVRAYQNRDASGGRADPKVYSGLRSMILQGSRAKFGLPPASQPTEPYGVLMDWGVDGGTATVVAVADGTASVYLSSGGGFIGGDQSHESIRAAAKRTVELATELQTADAANDNLPFTAAWTGYVLRRYRCWNIHRDRIGRGIANA